MAKKGSSFLGGALVGLGIGVAAAAFLASEKGKQFRKDAGRMMADFYREMSERAQDFKGMGKEEYEKFMAVAAKKYVKTKHISKELADYLSREAKKSWEHLTERWQEWKDA